MVILIMMMILARILVYIVALKMDCSAEDGLIPKSFCLNKYFI